MPRGRKPEKKTAPRLQGAPDKPDYLDPVASREWDRIVRLLNETGNLSVVDADAIALYCLAFSRYLKCERAIAADGLTTTAPNGCLMQSPYVKIQKEAEATMYRLLCQFGLTPKSRNTVKQQDKKPQVENKWADFTG